MGRYYAGGLIIFIYLLAWLIPACICGAVSRYISKNKGYEGGFAWGFFLGLIGIVVVASKRDLTYGDPIQPMGRWFCARCNAANADTANFCGNCGETRPNHWICQGCSAGNPLSGRFCQKCGREKAH